MILNLDLGFGARIGVLSDMQRTAFVERLLFREQNDEERARIVSALVRARPDVVLLLGDLVFCGSSTRGWARFDALVAPLREAGIELLPILGNHDCWSIGPRALGHFFERFPRLEGRRFYAAKLGPLGLVALDSNRFWMPRARWDEQLTFYETSLGAFDADPEIRGVLVIVHHPPFTNGTVTGPSALVTRSFVPGFERSRKPMMMLAGHVHAYEHFLRSDRHYMVCGGGGGPRHRLREPGARVFEDLFEGKPLRDFHFLMLSPGKTGLDVEATGLAKGATESRPMDTFRVAWPG